MLSGLAAMAMPQRKSPRSKPPTFKPGQFEGTFFADAKSKLRGELPSERRAVVAQQPSNGDAQQPASNDPLSWNNLISQQSLEDLIKGSKLRLDGVITTPPAFVSGGYAIARKEFSLLGVLFGVIEEYPEDIRWKASAPAARELLSRAGANAKVGSLPVFNEAKNRMLDLGDLLRGTQLAHEAKSELVWEQMIDRTPLMQLLEWSQEENLSDLVADGDEFEKNADAIRRYADLIGVLGRVAIAEEMPDANDDDYRAYALAMIEAAREVKLAVETKNADLARKASGRIGQSCSDCHGDFQ